jgi:hypothetical protein
MSGRLRALSQPVSNNNKFGLANTSMKCMFPIIALSVLVTACRTSPSASQTQQNLIGTWTTEFSSPRVAKETIKNKADGTYVLTRSVDSTNAVTEEGAWQVKGGFFIATPTRTPWPDDPATFEVWSNKVVAIDNHKMALLNCGGETNELVFHKK